MSSYFGDYFLKGFYPAAQQSYGYAERNRMMTEEDERRKREALAFQKQQQGYLSDLIKGTKQSFSYGGMYSPLVEQQVPLTKEEQFGRYTQLSPANQNAYEWWNRQNAPKQKRTVTIGNQIFEESPEYENVPIGEPKYTKPTEPKETEEFVDADTVKGLENFKGYKVSVTKRGDEVVRYGQPFKRTVEKQDGNGNLYETLNKDYLKELKQRADRFLTSVDMKSAADKTKGGIPYSDPLTGMKYTITSETAGGMVESGKNQLQSFLDNNGSEQNKSYFKNIQLESWDAVTKEGRGDHGVTTWKYVEEDYINGDISDADFLESKYRFIAKWGYDPTTRLR